MGQLIRKAISEAEQLVGEMVEKEVESLFFDDEGHESVNYRTNLHTLKIDKFS